jgi:hypothetical protein
MISISEINYFFHILLKFQIVKIIFEPDSPAVKVAGNESKPGFGS